MKKKIFLGIIGGLLVVTIGIIIVVLSVLHEASLDLNLQRGENVNSANSRLIIEQESEVRADHLHYYLLFSENEVAPETFLEEALEGQKIEKKKSAFYIREDLTLNPLHANDCSKIYCYQHRRPFSKIPGPLLRSLVGIEDYRYLFHNGVDLLSVMRALYVDLRAMKFVQGGSTLTQQLIKNLFLSNERTVTRKLKEIIYSVYLESKYTKEEILAAYLNEVEWGAMQGIQVKGFFAASLFYFQKKPQDMNDIEVAILISLLKGPSYYSPLKSGDRLQERTQVVLKKLYEDGLIGELVTDEQLNAYFVGLKERLAKLQIRRPFYYVWESLTNTQPYLNMYEKMVLGLSVAEVNFRYKQQINSQDVAYKVMIGPVNCRDPQCLGDDFGYYSKFERNREDALLVEKHQIGSVIKPILYSKYFKSGLNFNDMVSTDKVSFRLPTGKTWEPGEASQTVETELPIIEALRRSKNRPTLRLAQQVGLKEMEDHLVNYFPEMQKPLAAYPSQMLGSLEMNMAALFKSYRSFIRQECIDFKKSEIELKNQREIPGGASFDEEADPFQETLLFQMAQPESTTIRAMVAERLKAFHFFGKTGTTNNGLDNWYVAFDGREIYLVWFGLEGNRLNKKLKLSGSQTAFLVYQEFILNRGKRIHELDCRSVF